MRRAKRTVTHQVLDLISRAARVGDIAPERVPKLMRGDSPVQAGPAHRSRDDAVDRGGRDRRPRRLRNKLTSTNCPEPGVIRTGLAQLLVIAMTMFRSTT